MTAISLSFYEIKIHLPRKRKEVKKLDHLEGSNSDLLPTLHSFFSKLPQFDPNKVDILKGEDWSNLFLERVTSIKDRQFSGIIRTGDDGIGSDLFSGKNGKKEFTRDKHHIEMMPFYFLVDIPVNSKKAILSFQTFGVHGISTKLNSQIRDFLQKIYAPKYSVKLRVIHIGNLYLDKIFKDGKLHQIEATKYYTGGDIASVYEGGIKCSYSLSPIKRGLNFKDGMKRIFSRKDEAANVKTMYREVKEILAVELPGKIDEMKIEVSFGGKRRKIDLEDRTKFATKFDIENDVLKDKTGHPVFSSIDAIAKEIVEQDIRSLIKG